MLTTNEVGAQSEARALSALLAAGYHVLIPFGTARYDLVIELDGSFKRVQVKTGRLEKGAVIFPPYSRKGPYTAAEIDYFAVWCGALDSCYLVPLADVGSGTSGALRVEPPRNKQIAGIKFAETYRLKPL